MSSTTNMKLSSKNMHDSYTNITANMCAFQIHENNNLSDFQSLVPSIIPYIVRLTKFGT